MDLKSVINNYPILSVKQPFADLLLTLSSLCEENCSSPFKFAIKSIERRSTNSGHTGIRIGIHATKSVISSQDFDDLDSMGDELAAGKNLCHSDCMTFADILYNKQPVRGAIIGTVFFVKTEVPDAYKINLYRPLHFNPESWFTGDAKEKVYFWHFRDPVKFKEPIPFSAKSITWNKASEELNSLIIKRELEVKL